MLKPTIDDDDGALLHYSMINSVRLHVICLFKTTVCDVLVKIHHDIHLQSHTLPHSLHDITIISLFKL